MTTANPGPGRARPAPSGVPSIRDAAHTDRRALLEALRDHVAAVIDDGCPVRELAALVRRVEALQEQIDDLPDPADESPADKIAREREARRAARAAAEGADPIVDGEK